MFANGPLSYRGDMGNQDLRFFILKVDADFNIVDVDGSATVDNDDVFKIAGAAYPGYAVSPGLASFNNSFGGRMFTKGLDRDGNGYTDIVFLGVNQQTGSTFSGNVMGVAPKTTGIAPSQYNDPTDKRGNPGTETVNWSFSSVFSAAQSPVTSKIAHGTCFDSQMIYFGTGRWFFKDDEPGKNINDTEQLHGIKIKECLDDLAAGGNCNMNFAHSNSSVCSTIYNDQMGWTIDILEPRGNNYLKERTITDPTFCDTNADPDCLESNIVFFTTMQPSSRPCDFGGRSRLWSLNCISGTNIFNGECDAYHDIDVPAGMLLLQLSGGNIEDARLDDNTFSELDNRATDWMTGVPPESATPFVPPPGGLTGQIILWIER